MSEMVYKVFNIIDKAVDKYIEYTNKYRHLKKKVDV